MKKIDLPKSVFEMLCKKVILSLLILSFSAPLHSGKIEEDRPVNIEQAINRGVTYLVNNQNEDGSVSLDNDETFKVWETANAFLAVHTADRTKTFFLKKAMDFLISCQRQDGSFYSAVSFEKEHYCMETTSVSLLALAAADKDISRGIQFILDKQRSDGSWEIGIPQIETERSFPSVTGHVLSTLLCLNVKEDTISEGMTYLLKTQKSDGSWGKSWVYYDTPYYATHMNLLALKLYGVELGRNYRRAVAFIKKSQNLNGSWGIDGIDRPSLALRTSLALNSLLIFPDKTDSQSIDKGIDWLWKNQSPDGHWNGGCFVNFSGKKEDIFCTAVAILALKRYEAYQRNEMLLCLY